MVRALQFVEVKVELKVELKVKYGVEQTGGL